MKSKSTKCLYPPCDKPAFIRGLCRSCYQQAGNAVRAGKTTWEKLKAQGRVTEARTKAGVTNWLLGKDQ